MLLRVVLLYDTFTCSQAAMTICNVLPCPYGHMLPRVSWEGIGGTIGREIFVVENTHSWTIGRYFHLKTGNASSALVPVYLRVLHIASLQNTSSKT